MNRNKLVELDGLVRAGGMLTGVGPFSGLYCGIVGRVWLDGKFLVLDDYQQNEMYRTKSVPKMSYKVFELREKMREVA